MTPNREYHIIVQSPPGGLARQLSLLIHYALNENVAAPDWAAPIISDFKQKETLLGQSVLDSAKIIGLEPGAAAAKCRYTSLSVPKIREQYSNCKIIQIHCERDDYLQLAWNYLIEDSFKGMGQLFVDNYFTNFIKTAHNDPDLDFVELLKDPQSYSDPRVVLLLNMVSRGHRRYPYEISMEEYDATEPNGPSFLKVNFADICKPEHGDTTAGIIKVIDFLGKEAVRGVEVSELSWRQLMKRLSQMEKTS